MTPNRLTAVAALAATLLAGPMAAFAAEGDDPDEAAAEEEFVDIEMPETLPLPTGGDIYLRVDAAYRMHDAPSGWAFAAGGLVDEDLGAAAALGLGLGYRASDLLRFDATVDWGLDAEAEGTLPCPGGCADLSADVSSVATMVNLYADLGDFAGLTPYVGAGVGAAYVRASDVAAAPAAATGGDHRWNLAYALMAGVGYEVADGLTVDLGYRYLDLGRVGVTVGGEGVRLDDLAAHEVRIGLRYAFQ